MIIPDDKDGFEFDARSSILYHEVMERRCTRWTTWATFASLALSSVAFAAITKHLPMSDFILAGSALVVAILNIGVVSFGFAERAKAHALHKAQWHAFLGQLVRTDEDLRSLTDTYVRICAAEPTPDEGLLVACFERTKKVFQAEYERQSRRLASE